MIKQIDIAKRLQVSRITVSKALRDHSDISTEMKEKVKQVAAELGYIPNRLASQLHTKKTFTIGVVVPGIANAYFSLAADSIIEVANKAGYHAIMTVSRENAEIERENILTLLSMQVDGLLIACSAETTDVEVFQHALQRDIPIVMFDRLLEDVPCSTIQYENCHAAEMLIEHVIHKGFTKIAHFAGPQQTNVGRERYQGYIAAMQKHQIPVRQEWIIPCGFSVESGFMAFQQLLQHELPQVIFAVNDRVAYGIYKACRQVNLRIPDDIRIVAFGHAEFAALLHPTLTNINTDPFVLGQRAVELLLENITEPNIQHITLQPILEINESF